MFHRTAVARLRCTPIARGVGPFVMYLIRSKGKHTGMPVTERAKKVAAEYRALSPTKLAELRKAGLAHKTLPKKGWRMREAEKKENKIKGIKRAPSAWTRTIKAHYHEFTHLPVTQRFGAIAAKYGKK
jgi:hypothetical protein